MKKIQLNAIAWAASAVVLGLGAGLARAQDSVPAAAAENSARLWFVELSGSPVADGNSLAAVQGEKAAFRSAAAAAGIRYTERRAYDVLFNGFAVDIAPSERGKLAQLAGVKAMYAVGILQAPSPEVSAGTVADLASAIQMTGADIAQNSLGLTGKGIKVGIIDTGIDIDHPAFGGNGSNHSTPFPTARVITGYDFVGDGYNSGGSGAELIPQPDANPDDCAGHGTHVAGIVGGNGGGIKGVAPEVSFGAYRVFGCTGSTSDDVLLAAYERAYADGMQVINQSLGSGRQWPQYPTAQASTRLVNKGIVMVASIGNNGPGGSQPDGLFAAGAPGVADKVIGVASYDNTQVTLPSFTVNGTPQGYLSATGAPAAPTSGSLPMSRTGTPTAAADACSPLPAGSLAGTAVLIRRGTCGFYVKAFNAQAAGAAAVVLYNNTTGFLNPTVAGAPPITIPVVAVTAAQGTAINNMIAAGPTTLTWTGTTSAVPNPTGGLISGFSSFGLTAELGLKPNIGAPGGNIYSSYPLELGGAASLSGTSMSSPHVAGGVALMLQARPKTNPNAMMARLQNSADPKNWSGNPGLGFLDFSFRQGAGMLDIVGSVQSTTVVEPSQIAVGESAAGPKAITLTVRNESASPVTYDLSHVASLASGENVLGANGSSYGPGATMNAPASVSFSAPSVLVPANGSASVQVTIDANAGLPDRSLYGGYVVLTPQGGGAVYRVPYAGLKGDYQSMTVLKPTMNGFPWLAQLVGNNLAKRANGGSYTMVNGDIPYFLIHLDHLSRRVRLDVTDAVSGKSWHRISDDQYVTRNSSYNGFFAFTWDGSTFTGKGKNAGQWMVAPNGQYKVTVSVLKALGDENNPADWETWTSPVVTIARP
jgi:minor extracellular serine protease Vpr